VIALDGAAGAASRTGGADPERGWRLHPERVLVPGDRVVVAATRRGLAELLGRGARNGPRGQGEGADNSVRTEAG
ncbi:potassium transporter TrkA, partial [Streptomyces sp. NPDC056361]